MKSSRAQSLDEIGEGTLGPDKVLLEENLRCAYVHTEWIVPNSIIEGRSGRAILLIGVTSNSSIIVLNNSLAFCAHYLIQRGHGKAAMVSTVRERDKVDACILECDSASSMLEKGSPQ